MSSKYTISFIFLVLISFKLTSQQNFASGKINTIVIDPGHGGKDPGALGKMSKEKDIVLGICNKVAQFIKYRNPEVKVILTRGEDEFVELFERANIANENKADLFISVHANANVRKDVSGVEFWVLGMNRIDENLEVAKKENAVLTYEKDVTKNYGFDPNSSEGNIMMTMKQSLYLDRSIQFAKLLEKKFGIDESQINRGTKQAGFVVLYKTAMPSVLLEVGFISNVEEEQYMTNDYGQTKIATKIAYAFAEYKSKYESGLLKDEQLEEEKKKLAEPEPARSFGSAISDENPLPKKEVAVTKVEKKVEPKVEVKATAPKVEKPKAEVAKATQSISSSLFNEKPKSTSLTEKKEKKIIVLDDEVDSKTLPANTETPKPIATYTKKYVEPPIENKPTPKVVESKPNTIKAEAPKPIASKPIESKPIETNTSGEKTEYAEYKKGVPSFVNDPNVKKEVMGNTQVIDQVYKEDDITSTASKAPLADVKSATISNDLVFKVQLKASKSKVKSDDPIFSVKDKIEVNQEDDLYKYLVGSYKTEAEATSKRDDIRSQGVSDAFVVKYSGGKRVK